MNYTERRKRQGQETERKILNAALALMRERSFDKVSIRDICREADITTGAFYHHFPSKEAMLESGFAPLDDFMRQSLASNETLPPDERLQVILKSYVGFMEGSRELIGRYYQRRLAEPSTKSMDESRYTIRVMLDCFRQAAQEGLLVAGCTPEWVTDFCYRHFRGVVIDWVLHSYAYSLEAKVREDYEFFVALFRA